MVDVARALLTYELIEPVSTNLSTTDCYNGIINNYGQSLVRRIGLPVATAGLSFTAMFSTPDIATRFEAQAGELIYVDEDDGDMALVIDPVAGDCARFFTFQTGAGTYAWCCEPISGVWISGTSPNYFSPCVLWLEADRDVTLDGLNVVGVGDQSGEGSDVAQAIETKRPAYDSDGLGGNPTLDFDGTDNYLLCETISGFTGLTGATVVMALRVNDTATNQGIIGFENSAILAQIYDGALYMNIGTSQYNQYTFTDTEPCILTAVYDGTQTGDANRLKVFKNGLELPRIGGTSIPASLPETTFFNVGVAEWGGYFDGLISAAAIFPRAMTTSERQRMERTWGTKYEIAVA